MQNNIYDFFAEDYHNKRRHHWGELEKFIRELNDVNIYFKGFNLDLGCANGRNFNLFLNNNSKLVGIDNSKEFLKFTLKRLREQNLGSNLKSKHINLILSDMRALPLRANTIANVFSVATIHHIGTNIQRKKVLTELYNVVKDKGFLLLTVWRRYQKKYRYDFIWNKVRRSLFPTYRKAQKKSGLTEYGDKYISWTLSNKNLTYNRFYHFFSRREIKKLLKNYSTKVMAKRGGPNKKDNFFILTQKVVEKT
ncbi:MAG: class I SAM-dependent methyltransferase [Candidatus Hermodarchaeota archaeon]